MTDYLSWWSNVLEGPAAVGIILTFALYTVRSRYAPVVGTLVQLIWIAWAYASGAYFMVGVAIILLFVNAAAIRSHLKEAPRG